MGGDAGRGGRKGPGTPKWAPNGPRPNWGSQMPGPRRMRRRRPAGTSRDFILGILETVCSEAGD